MTLDFSQNDKMMTRIRGNPSVLSDGSSTSTGSSRTKSLTDEKQSQATNHNQTVKLCLEYVFHLDAKIDQKFKEKDNKLSELNLAIGSNEGKMKNNKVEIQNLSDQQDKISQTEEKNCY
ncbi:hypothetical protein JTB14_013274 [Gonioctena quinquepunctata]|nr:hypothetical protein JTB14_013274 [Gonioctena quinquepunctata]